MIDSLAQPLSCTVTLTMYSMKAALNAFSLEHVPHIIVVTSVSPVGASCGRERGGEREGERGREGEREGEGGGGKERDEVLIMHSAHKVFHFSYWKKGISEQASPGNWRMHPKSRSSDKGSKIGLRGNSSLDSRVVVPQREGANLVEEVQQHIAICIHHIVAMGTLIVGKECNMPCLLQVSGESIKQGSSGDNKRMAKERSWDFEEEKLSQRD